MNRATALTPSQMWRLDQACSAIREAVGVAPYLVGSVLERPDPRDAERGLHEETP